MSKVCDICNKNVDEITSTAGYTYFVYAKLCDVCYNTFYMCSECFFVNERHYVCLGCKRNEKIKGVLGDV